MPVAVQLRVVDWSILLIYLIGVILVGYGALAEPTGDPSVINVTWGAVLMVFGASMLGLAYRCSTVVRDDA